MAKMITKSTAIYMHKQGKSTQFINAFVTFSFKSSVFSKAFVTLKCLLKFQSQAKSTIAPALIKLKRSPKLKQGFRPLNIWPGM